MFKKILVATDGSNMGDRAVTLASDLSRVHDAQILVIHVLNLDDDHPDYLRIGQQAYDQTGVELTETVAMSRQKMVVDIESHRQAAQEIAERLLNAATLVARDHGVTKVKTIVEFGKPAECILDVAKREKADAIVMGSHGYSDLKGLFVGSVSHQVAHEADCPCIAIT